MLNVVNAFYWDWAHSILSGALRYTIGIVHFQRHSQYASGLLTFNITFNPSIHVKALNSTPTELTLRGTRYMIRFLWRIKKAIRYLGARSVRPSMTRSEWIKLGTRELKVHFLLGQKRVKTQLREAIERLCRLSELSSPTLSGKQPYLHVRLSHCFLYVFCLWNKH